VRSGGVRRAARPADRRGAGTTLILASCEREDDVRGLQCPGLAGWIDARVRHGEDSGDVEKLLVARTRPSSR
jgi:hypothetical protein